MLVCSVAERKRKCRRGAVKSIFPTLIIELYWILPLHAFAKKSHPLDVNSVCRETKELSKASLPYLQFNRCTSVLGRIEARERCEMGKR